MSETLSNKAAAAVRRVNGELCAKLPEQIRDGHDYEPPKGEKVDVPDGVYRVTGSEFLLRFAEGRFTYAKRALPPDYGGPSVIAVPWQEPDPNPPKRV